MRTDIEDIRIEKHFNQPAPRLMKWCWERMIRFVKMALKRIMKECHSRKYTVLENNSDDEIISKDLLNPFIRSDPPPPLCQFNKKDLNCKRHGLIYYCIAFRQYCCNSILTNYEQIRLSALFMFIISTLTSSPFFFLLLIE